MILWSFFGIISLIALYPFLSVLKNFGILPIENFTFLVCSSVMNACVTNVKICVITAQTGCRTTEAVQRIPRVVPSPLEFPFP